MAFSEEAKLRMALRQALKLLDEAKQAINADLAAAGSDEVRQHPTLRARDRLSGKIEKFLGRHP